MKGRKIPPHTYGSPIVLRTVTKGMIRYATCAYTVTDSGDTVTINWRDSPDRTFLFPNGSPLENYEFYKVLAESDVGLAAYQLANMMSRCSHTYLSRSELDSSIKQMRETFTYYDPELDARVRLGKPEEVERAVVASTALFEGCKDFSAEQRGEHQRWMELAANNGHTAAMLDYGRTLDDPVASVALYRSAWQQGFPRIPSIEAR